jgi:hypothetical protein
LLTLSIAPQAKSDVADRFEREMRFTQFYVARSMRNQLPNYRFHNYP